MPPAAGRRRRPLCVQERSAGRSVEPCSAARPGAPSSLPPERSAPADRSTQLWRRNVRGAPAAEGRPADIGQRRPLLGTGEVGSPPLPSPPRVPAAAGLGGVPQGSRRVRPLSSLPERQRRPPCRAVALTASVASLHRSRSWRRDGAPRAERPHGSVGVSRNGTDAARSGR